jgi:TPR repeat protein
MLRRIILCLLAASMLTSCATSTKKQTPPPAVKQPKFITPGTTSKLENGKRLFQDGYYKRAMEQLLPLAAEGIMEAEYAVGYMYYYGFGAAQDTASGDFWIGRAAAQHYEPAIKALAIMHQNKKHGDKENNAAF